MDALLERASQLQEQRDEVRTLAEVKEVGAELNIDPGLVDQAFVQLQVEQVAAAARRTRVRRLAALVGGGLVAMVLITGWVGACEVQDAEHAAVLAETNLDAVLRRQATLTPQLIALAGGEVGDLAELAAQLTSAADIDARRTAADRLQLRMAELLGRLPPAVDAATSQQRLELQYELVGAQNRVTLEQRRFEEAHSRWRSAAATFSGSLAVILGFSGKPP